MFFLWLTIILLLASAAVIYSSCEFFVKKRRHLCRGAFGGSMATKELGAGAVLSGPGAFDDRLGDRRRRPFGHHQKLPKAPDICDEFMRLSRDQGGS
jgi:hypothetical protein